MNPSASPHSASPLPLPIVLPAWIKTSDLMWPAVSILCGAHSSNKANSLHLLIIWSVYVTKITKAGAAANAWAAPHEVQENICHLLKPQSTEWKRLLVMEDVEVAQEHPLVLLSGLESKSAATFDKTDVQKSLAWMLSSFFCEWFVGCVLQVCFLVC